MPTVLVVDDEPDILEVLKLSLEAAGYRVLTAADGAQALDVIEHEVPDAMLLDIGMPEIDGWGVLERIKQSAEVDVSSVPVVMVTAWTSDEDRMRGGIEGAVHYVGKPFNPAHVVKLIEELLAEGGPTEPELRRKVQQATLARLARAESGGATADGAARVRLTRLDRPRVVEPEAPDPLSREELPGFLERLSDKQRMIVEALIGGASVGDVADGLQVSRSNVYAILRRVAKHAGVRDGRALIHRLHRIGAPPSD